MSLASIFNKVDTLEVTEKISIPERSVKCINCEKEYTSSELTFKPHPDKTRVFTECPECHKIFSIKAVRLIDPEIRAMMNDINTTTAIRDTNFAEEAVKEAKALLNKPKASKEEKKTKERKLKEVKKSKVVDESYL